MQKVVHNLRQQSEHMKLILAFTGAGIITVILIILWIVALPSGKPFDVANANPDEADIEKSQPASIFQSLFGRKEKKSRNTPSNMGTTPIVVPVNQEQTTTTASPTNSTAPTNQPVSIYEPEDPGVIIPEPTGGNAQVQYGDQVFIENQTPDGSYTNETTYDYGEI